MDVDKKTKLEPFSFHDGLLRTSMISFSLEI